VSFRVRVTNVGPVAGDEVVLAFVTRDNADRGPLKQLFAFERVHLNPGTRPGPRAWAVRACVRACACACVRACAVVRGSSGFRR
jgi:hypothetical protein